MKYGFTVVSPFPIKKKILLPDNKLFLKDVIYIPKLLYLQSELLMSIKVTRGQQSTKSAL